MESLSNRLLNRIKEGFVITIGGDYQKKNIIFLGLKKFQTSLNIQERIWLETLAYISSILLENFQLIEELFHKIEYYKEEERKKSIPLGFQDYYLQYLKKKEPIYRLIYMIPFCRIYCNFLEKSITSQRRLKKNR